MKILFTGGGSGGHVVPIIAITREIRKIYTKKDLNFYYLGPSDDFGQILLSQEDIEVKTILAGKIRRYSHWKTIFQNLLDVLIKIPVGVIQSLSYLFVLSPDLIFSKGGFGSIPGVIAGKILFIPVFLHEGDVTPGLANRFLAKLGRQIFVSFPTTEYFPLKKMMVVGNPIRREVLEGDKKEAKNFFKLSGIKPVLLILGGSQGARRINNRVLEILPDLLENFEIVHQCGEKNYKQVKAEAKEIIRGKKELEKFYHPYSFFKEPELRQAYAAGDLIISRAGSGSIFEIAGLGKSSILIPLPEAAQNHQVKNAYAYQESGACLVIEEPNFTPHFFLEKLKYLFSHPEELNKMAEAAKKFAKPEAGRIIANYLIDYLTK